MSYDFICLRTLPKLRICYECLNILHCSHKIGFITRIFKTFLRLKVFYLGITNLTDKIVNVMIVYIKYLLKDLIIELKNLVTKIVLFCLSASLKIYHAV